MTLSFTTNAQQALNLQLYQQGTGNPNLTTNSFTSIAVTKYGLVWAGSLNQGLYRLNTKAATPQWEKMPQITQVGIRDLKTDRRGGLWAAHTGLNPASTAITGGVDNYDSLGTWVDHYGHLANNGNLQTRAVRSLYVAPNRIVWAANASTLTAGVTNKGGLSFMSEGATQFTKSVANIPGLDGSCQAIGGGGTTPEVWIAMNRSCPASGACFSTRLVRYSGAGVFLGYIDNTISRLPLSNASPGVLVRAIHFDRFNRAWVGFSDGSFAICDLSLSPSAWTYISSSSIVPAGAAVNFNAITSDGDGNVYIGTTQGLIIYTQGADPALAVSYNRFGTQDGLPSNNINGIALGINGDRWLATGAGIVRWISDPLRMYHLKTAGSYGSGARTSLNYKAVGAIKVTADNSETTLFTVAMANAQNLALRVRERTSPFNFSSDIAGALRVVRRTTDSLLVVYKHPAYLDSTISYKVLHLDLVDTASQGAPRPIASYRVQVEMPPLMLVHGLWSTGVAAFPKLRDKLLDSLYNDVNKVRYANYAADRELSFTYNQFVDHKNALLHYYQQQNISAGKVDIISHSMGGLVSRYYIGTNGYANDINKLITLNTPHSGSPLPNFIRMLPLEVKIFMAALDKNPLRGASEDLSYTSAALVSMNSNLNTKKVYLHAFTTTTNLNLPLSKLVLNNPARLGPYKLILGWLVLSKGVSAFDAFLQNSVFTNPNDLIVGLNSQTGGLTGNYTQRLTNIDHISSGENAVVHQRMVNLLRENPKSNFHFTNNNYKPDTITSIFKRVSAGTPKTAAASSPPARTTTSTLAITSPTRGSLQTNLDSIQVVVAGSADVTDIILVCGGKSVSVYTKLIMGSSGSAYIQVPKDLLGRVHLAAFAFSDTSYVKMDTLSFQVSTTATLNAIRIDPGFLQVKRNDSTLVDAVGLFSDGTQRSLLGAPGVTVQFPNGLARLSQQGQVVGLTVGTDSLRVRYGGKRAAIPITIEANPCTNPVAGAGADKTTCTAGSVALGGQAGQPGITYNWRVTPAITGFNSTQAQPTVTMPAVSAAMRYVFTLTATNATLGNCSATDQVNVDVVPLPATPVATASPAIIAPGQTSTLSIANPASGTTYTWSGPGFQTTTGSSVVAAPTGTTQYAVVASNGACSSAAAQVNVTVTTTAPPTLTTWNGSVSTDWNNAANWSAGVPTPTLGALLPSGLSRYPQLASGPASMNALTLQAGSTMLVQNAQLDIAGDLINQGGTLSQSGGILSLIGNWVNNGTFTATGGLVNLTGPASQTLGGSSSTTFWSLTVGTADASLSAAASVQGVLTLTGNLTTNANALTLLSSSAGTAMAVNTGGRVVGAATMQRYLNPSLNPGLGYRHYSSPVNGNDLTDLATATFTPHFSEAYNSSATPGQITPFPTVFGYDQARLATVTNSFAAFDKGFFSPITGGMPADFITGRGYAVNLRGTEKVDFTGTLNSGAYAVALARNAGSTAVDAGWQLLGNPYPAPLDWSLVASADRPNVDAAIYVVESSSQYGGSYRASVNGMGGNANSGSALIGTAQGFFVRVSAGQTSGSVTFRNSQRITDFATQVAVKRGASDTRPQLRLTLSGSGANPLTDDLMLYAEAGATAGADREFDAIKLANPSGLNLASLSATGQELAIDARPALSAATSIQLAVRVPQAGTYAFSAANVANLPVGTALFLRDALTGARTRLTAGARYAATLAGTSAPGRFFLDLGAANVLSTALSRAAQVLVYPTPAHDQLTVLRPLGPAPSAQLFNSLGQLVRTIALPTAETRVPLRGLALGVYTLRLTLDGQPVTRRVVVE